MKTKWEVRCAEIGISIPSLLAWSEEKGKKVFPIISWGISFSFDRPVEVVNSRGHLHVSHRGHLFKKIQ